MNDLRMRHLVERVYDLGPAPLMHLLLEIEARADLEETLERYARLPADFVRALAGERFPDRLVAVAGGRP